ncbi:TetR/AcrR family transcriptional regulator [Pseudoroseicyclus sp. H15]
MPRTGLTAEELREKATDVALQRMREVGYSKVRLTDVAAALDVSHAALYAHFSCKAGLLDAVVRRWLLETEEALARIVAGPGSAEERLIDWVLTRHRMSRQRALHDPEPFAAFDFASDKARPVITAHLQVLTGQIAALLAEAGLSGGPGDHPAQVMMEAMRAFQHPSFVAHHVADDREPLMLEVVRTVLAGLRAGGASQ